MASIVEITQASDVVTCDENGQATISFTVSNKNISPPRQRRVGFRINVEGEAKRTWFEIEGRRETTLEIDGTEVVAVKIKVADGNPDVIYKFSLLVFDVTNMDEDYTQSKTIAVKLPAKKDTPAQPEPKSKKWLIWLIVGVVAISIIAVIAIIFLKDKKKVEPPVKVTEQVLKKVPDVTDKTLEGASELLNSLGFKKIKTQKQFFLKKHIDTVLKQIPDIGSEVNPEEVEIILTIADHGVKVPNVKGKLFTEAVKELQESKLQVVLDNNKIADPNVPESTVKEQSPQGGQSVEEETEVILKVSTQPKRAPKPDREHEFEVYKERVPLTIPGYKAIIK